LVWREVVRAIGALDHIYAGACDHFGEVWVVAVDGEEIHGTPPARLKVWRARKSGARARLPPSKNTTRETSDNQYLNKFPDIPFRTIRLTLLSKEEWSVE